MQLNDYLAHVPAKWEAFALQKSLKDAPPNPAKKAFVHVFPKSRQEAAALLGERDAEARRLEALKRRQRPGDGWMMQMKKIVDQERLEEEAKRRAEELNAMTQARHRKQMARRERDALAPTTAAGTPLPVQYHRLQDAEPKAVQKLRGLLAAGGDVEVHETRTRIEAHEAKQKQRMVAAADVRQRHVEEVASRANASKSDIADHIRERTEKEQETALRRRQEQTAKDAEARANTFERSEAHRSAAEARALEDRASSQARTIQRNAAASEAQQRSASVVAAREQQAEAKLRDQMAKVEERRRVAETLRFHKAQSDEHDVEQRVNREERAAALRQAKLDEASRAEKRREERVAEAAQRAAEIQTERIRRHQAKDMAVAQRKAAAEAAHEEFLDECLHRAKQPVRVFQPALEPRAPLYLTETDKCGTLGPSDAMQRSQSAAQSPSAGTVRPRTPSSPVQKQAGRSPKNETLARNAITPGGEFPALSTQRAAHAQALRSRQDARTERRRSSVHVLRNHQQDTTFAMQVASGYVDVKRRMEEREVRRQEARRRAFQLQEDRQAELDAKLSQHQAASERQIEATKVTSAQHRATEAERREARIAACRTEVNVDKQKRAFEEMRAKDARRLAFEEEEALRRKAQEAANNAESAERQRRVDESVERAEQLRDERSASTRAERDKRIAAASAAREQHLRGITSDYAKRDEENTARLKQLAKADAVQRKKMLAAMQRREAAVAAAQAEHREERCAQLEQRGAMEAARRNAVEQRHAEERELRRQRARERVAYTQQRAQTSLDVRRHNVQAVVSDARALALTPTPLWEGRVVRSTTPSPDRFGDDDLVPAVRTSQ